MTPISHSVVVKLYNTLCGLYNYHTYEYITRKVKITYLYTGNCPYVFTITRYKSHFSLDSSCKMMIAKWKLYLMCRFFICTKAKCARIKISQYETPKLKYVKHNKQISIITSVVLLCIIGN